MADLYDLLGVSRDASPDEIPPEKLARLSAKVTGKKHPAVLYLVRGDPCDQPPRLVRDEANDRWLLETEMGRSGVNAKPLRLWIVVAGRAPEH